MNPGRFCGGIQPGRLTEEILLDPGDLLHPVQGIVVSNPVNKSVPAMNVLGYERLVIQLFLDDHMMKTHRQGRIRTRSHL